LIFREGDPGDGMYVVRSGAVQISGVINSGQRQVFSTVAVGDVFGEMAVLDDLPRSASASAQEETSVYFVPRQHILDLLKSSPTLSLVFLQEISGRLREFNRQYMEKVLQAERMALVGRFASSIVHDLKNPLTIISMATDTAVNEKATLPMRLTARDRIDRQVERITSMVNDILEFTRGAPTTQAYTLVDYAEFATNLVEEIQQDITHKMVQLEFENAPPAIKLPLNPKRLVRVFHNLVHNAVDMMPQGGTVSFHFDATEREVVTTIRDAGPGIAAQVMDQIFEPFVTFGKPRGTGLGLSISQRIIEEHQGSLSARNHPDGGAVFTIVLPRNR
jgi:signal transduction histidine kinase